MLTLLQARARARLRPLAVVLFCLWAAPGRATSVLHVVPRIQVVLEGREAQFEALLTTTDCALVNLGESPKAAQWRFTNPSGMVFEKPSGTFSSLVDVDPADRLGASLPDDLACSVLEGPGATWSGPLRRGEVRAYQVEVRVKVPGEAQALRGEATLLVLAADPFRVVGACFPDWLETQTDLLPFCIYEPPRTPRVKGAYEVLPSGGKLEVTLAGWPSGGAVVGAGTPFEVHTDNLDPQTAGLELITHSPGFATRWRDLSPDLVAREDKDANPLVEELRVTHTLFAPMATLHLGALQANAYLDPAEMTLKVFDKLFFAAFGAVVVRQNGLLPWVGNAVAQPGCAEGWREGARFREPLGMALVTRAAQGRRSFLVADRANHTLSLVTQAGRSVLLGGTPGVPGHRDGLLSQALFNRPTFVVQRPTFDGDEEYLVADTGNHVIRRIYPGPWGVEKLQVATLAGLPACAGHRDDLRRAGKALFKEPHGLVADSFGTVYVADAGNHCIRKIHPPSETDGSIRVSTLAGSPVTREARDGGPVLAGFLQLKGMAPVDLDLALGLLLVVDGDSLRLVRSDGSVTTLAGTAKGPGHADFEMAGADPGRLRPCLREPFGISLDPRSAQPTYVVADTGNHALRQLVLHPERTVLTTLAGRREDPEARPGVGCGLIPGPFVKDERCAALAAPRHAVPCAFWGGQDLVVADGACLVVAARPTLPPELKDPVHAHVLELCRPGAAAPVQAFEELEEAVVMARMPRAFEGTLEELNGLPMTYRLDLVRPDGTVELVAEGACFRDQTLASPVLLVGPGPCQARLVTTSHQGVVACATADFMILERVPGEVPGPCVVPSGQATALEQK